jgi:hypothetical protein
MHFVNARLTTRDAPCEIIRPARERKAMYTLTAAAKATGLNRSTLFRAIRSGKISATQDAQGQWTMDPAEVHRVYPVASEDVPNVATQHGAIPLQRELEARIEGLCAVADLLRAQLTDALSQRDKWEEAFHQAQRLLAPPQSSATPVVAEKPRPRRWRAALVIALLVALALALGVGVDRLVANVDVEDIWLLRTGLDL